MSNGRKAAPISARAATTRPSIGFALGCLGVTFSLGMVALAFAMASNESPDKPGQVVIVVLGWIVIMGVLATKLGARQEWLEQNRLDYEASQAIRRSLERILSESAPVTDRSSDLHICGDARVGEVSRHFDQRMNASINGWLQHALNVHGWGVNIAGNSGGLSINKLGLSGASAVELAATAVNRTDLTGDGFLAVLEREHLDGRLETTRVIAPSLPACREYVVQLMRGLAASFGSGSHVYTAMDSYLLRLASSIKCETSRVSDQLLAMLRQSPDRRSTVSVVGDDLEGWAILGAAIRLGADGPWQQLFPIALIRAILAAVAQMKSAFPSLQTGPEVSGAILGPTTIAPIAALEQQ